MASSLRVNAIVPASGTNVAIGTAGGTVTYAASVSGISTFSSGIVVSAGSTSAPSISPSGNSNTGIFFPSADTVAFAEGGVEAARFDSNGRLGIGAANPLSTLDVRGGSILVKNLTNATNSSSTIVGSSIVNGNLSDYGVSIRTIVESEGLNTYGMQFFTQASYLTGQTEKVRIDGNGRVTMPYQPVFYAYQSGAAATSSTGIFNSTQWNTTLVNTGSCFNTSNGRFTAPVAGVYMFQIKALMRYSSATGAVEISLYKNGSNVVSRSFGYSFVTGSSDHDSITALGYVSLAVSDYVQMGISALGAGTDMYYGENLSSFCGHLIG